MSAEQIILIVVIAVLIILYPVLISRRNKKESERLAQQTNSLKRGDKVLTTSGIYGTIVDIHSENQQTIITIETGKGNKKGYLLVDAMAIYRVINEDVATSVEGKDAKQVETKAETEVAPQTVEDSKTEEVRTELTEEKKASSKTKKETKNNK